MYGVVIMSRQGQSPPGSNGGDKAGRVTLNEGGSIYERVVPPDPDAGLSLAERRALASLAAGLT